jgi:hypothetical protein
MDSHEFFVRFELKHDLTDRVPSIQGRPSWWGRRSARPHSGPRQVSEADPIGAAVLGIHGPWVLLVLRGRSRYGVARYPRKKLRSSEKNKFKFRGREFLHLVSQIIGIIRLDSPEFQYG